VHMCTAAPYWVEKPVSQDVAEGDTGTFRCRGEGIPEPTVKWLINGVPVTSELLLHTHACMPTQSHTHTRTHVHTPVHAHTRMHAHTQKHCISFDHVMLTGKGSETVSCCHHAHMCGSHDLFTAVNKCHIFTNADSCVFIVLRLNYYAAVLCRSQSLIK